MQIDGWSSFRMKERDIGSEFSLDTTKLNTKINNLYQFLKQYNTSWFDYGRSAIRFIPYPGEKKVLLPEFICESVIRCFPLDKICFYKVRDDFEIEIEDMINKIDQDVGLVYIVHYFGYLQHDLNMIKDKCRQWNVILVEDTTQSLFSVKDIHGDYAVASIRKWMPIPQGGVLYAGKDGLNIPITNHIPISNNNERIYPMIMKEIYLQGLYDTNKMYRELFEKCEDRIDQKNEIMLMSDITKYLIGCIDISDIISKRKRNVEVLQKGIEELGIRPIKKISEGECPLAFPIRVKNRDEFRKYLITNRIYCAVHWPYDGIRVHERKNALKNAEYCISLPIDQRYTEDDMRYIINVISKYGGDLSL